MSSPLLFQPLNIRGITFKNRIVMSPMCQYSSVDGFYNEWHLAHLGSRAMGGAGLVMTEATAVEPEGRISPDDAGLWKDEQKDMLKTIVKFLNNQGAVAGIQLAHAGRKGSAAAPWKGDQHLKEEEGGWETKAPSALGFGQNLWKTPKAITVEEIHQIQEKFVQAAKRAAEVGFQVIELHAANGYLLHQFLSPLANQRTDQYGGSFENRTRFLLEVVSKVRAAIPESVLLFVRLPGSDWNEKGWTVEEAARLSGELKAAKVDLVDVSSGFVIPNYHEIKFGPGFNTSFSEEIKKKQGDSSLFIGVSGGITDPDQAEELLKGEKTDLIFLGRELLRDPHFAWKAAKHFNYPVNQVASIQYAHWRV